MTISYKRFFTRKYRCRSGFRLLQRDRNGAIHQQGNRKETHTKHLRQTVRAKPHRSLEQSISEIDFSPFLFCQFKKIPLKGN